MSKPYALPPKLDRKVRQIAHRDGVPVEDFVVTAVSAMVKAAQTFHAPKKMTKAQAGARLLELLDRAPDVPPMPGDELPPDLADQVKNLRKRKPK